MDRAGIEDPEAVATELTAYFGENGGMTTTGAQWRRLLAGDDPGPFVVVNLMQLRPQAAYPDGDPDRGRSGLEALMAYGAGSAPRIAALGGQVLLQGPYAGTLVGEDHAWDIAVIVRWPDRRAFVDLFRDPLYRQAFRHRRAAVARYRAFRAAPL